MILAVLESKDGKLTKPALALIGALQKMGGDKVSLSVDQGAAEQATKYGFKKSLYSAKLDSPAEKLAPALVDLMNKEGASTLVGLSNSVGKDTFARAAEILEAGQASDITDIKDGGIFQRPVFAGNVLADVEILTDKKVITVRAASFDEGKEAGGGGAPESVELALDESITTTVTGFSSAQSERPDLGAADVVVSGGRALGSKDEFDKIVLELADALGAAVGASRAAVDSGYAPNDWQVGQTGKVVAPKLYIAMGISGAIQHLAGMKDSKVIVAINKDADAPIFEIADYGLVADLFEVVPKLTEMIKASR